jgi:hypothetical protein
MFLAAVGAATSALMTFRALGATLGIAGVGSILLSQLWSGVAALPRSDGLDIGALASGPETIAALDEPLSVRA